jgi:hypothetical protein
MMRNLTGSLVAFIIVSFMLLASCTPQATPAAQPQPAVPAAPAPTPKPETPKPAPTPILREVELKYDDGDGNILTQTFGSLVAVNQNGYLIDFLSPASPFTIKKVRLYGTVRLCPS